MHGSARTSSPSPNSTKQTEHSTSSRWLATAVCFSVERSLLLGSVLDRLGVVVVVVVVVAVVVVVVVAVCVVLALLGSAATLLTLLQ